MSDLTGDLPRWRGGWLNRLVAKPGFQRWAAAFPLTRGRARRDGAALFEIVQGFVSAQALMALVELDVFRRLRAGPMSPGDLGRAVDMPADRAQVLLQAGAALELLKRHRDGRFGLARKGAALMGVPGLETMIRHHRAFYADLADPVALLRGAEETQLAAFWPYVFGARGDIDPQTAATYSELMAQSQELVAEDTLREVSLRGAKHLLDVGGGTGAFLEAVGRRYPSLEMTVFDLSQVAPSAEARFARAGLSARVTIASGSFRDDPLPVGADAISLIRVLYDHTDETVRALLAKVFAALPPGGRLIISEPMSGGHRPERAGDVYFAFYTMAMQTGRARSAEEIRALCAEAGFSDIRSPRPARAFVTRTLTARKPSEAQKSVNLD
ncbi:MAG: methyltransferase [Pseudomonadota bacterium]